jgi:outer membrane protein OmpA-like peptidoglycan-associated protein
LTGRIVAARHLAALLVLFAPSAGRTLSRGSTGADFLKIGNGVRAVAMGSSFTAVGEDVYSLYWNPAGIGLLEAPEVAGSYVKLFDNVDGMGLYTGAAAIPNFPVAQGNTGVGFMALTSGTFDSTDPLSSVKAASGNASDLLVFVSYGSLVSESISAGATLKVIQRSLSGADPSSYQTDPVTGDSVATRSVNYRATGLGADLGALWESPDRGMSIGGSIQNIGLIGAFKEGFSMAFNGQSEILPVIFRLGGALRTKLWGQRFLGTADLTSYIDSITRPRLSLGAEYGLAGIAFFRIGWEQPLDSPLGRTALDFGARSGLASLPSPLRTGMGFRWQFTSSTLAQLDYAMAPFGTLGTVHQAALLVRWNIPRIPRAVTSQSPAALERKVAKAAIVIEPRQIRLSQPAKEWKVEITDDKGRVVKTFAGTGVPPKTLDWDGTDERGKVLPNMNKFNIVLKAKDVANKEVKSDSRVAAVSAEPQLRQMTGKPVYPEVVFALPQANYQKWQLEVQDSGRTVRSWEGQGVPSDKIKWDGMDAAGKAVTMKKPSYSWNFTDDTGQKTQGRRTLPQVDVAVKPEADSNQVRMVGVRFAGTESAVTEEHHQVMEKTARFIDEHPGAALTVESYSDAPGSDEDNYNLAKARAEKVLQALIEEHSLAADRVSLRVYGRSKAAPAYPNLKGDAQKQRVDLVINVKR